ncbi:translocation/assembly module TamB domain-containing protein [Leptolyngbya sp. DQ-M1]|uniref:translocation/assembly module TamB domain-containing protein n=1 Tax=Leptolyngbya sp. DQ-M1 TaxID=2933920 RepID=UPI003296B8A8
MTQSPDPNNRPETPTRRRLWLMLLGRVGLPIAALGALGIAGGIWYGSKFVQQDLAPLIERNLSELLDRPVELGKVESASLTGLRFGKSAIPATPNDRDRASVEGVEVGFNLLQLLLTRRLNLDITLLQPDVYLDQEKDGVWVKTQIKAQEQEGLIKTELQRIRFKDANIELDAFPKPNQKRIPVTLRQGAGEANFFDNNRQIAYTLDAESTKEGKLDLQGETIVNNGLNSNLNIRGQGFLVAEIDRLVKLPINLKQGRTNGNVNVQIRPDQRAVVRGTANFKDVTVEIPRLPQTFAKSSGNLQIDDTLITLEKVSSQLGKIPLTANGTIDTEKGFNLTANVRAVKVEDFFSTFKVNLPVAATGEATANVRVTGATQSPIISGSVRNTKTARVDRINLSQVSSDFRLDTKTLNLALSNVRAVPEVGGTVVASGNLNLDAPQSIAVNYQARNIPGDTIAALYNNRTLPVTVGRVNARGQVIGRLDRVQTIAQFQAPEATYPGTGEVVVTGRNVALRNAVFQVAGGTVTAQGQTIGDRFRGTVQASNVQASQFSSQVQGIINGSAQVAGSLSSPQLENIQASGQARLTNGNSFVNANFNAIAGRWQADTQIAGIALNQFSQQLRGDLSGNVRLTGALNALRPETVRANGQVRLSQGISLVTTPLVAQINWDGQKLNIPQATSSGFRANGTILANLSGTPQITGLNLAIQANGYALSNLPIPRPPVTQLSGVVDLVGRITGTPDRPSVVSTVSVRGLSLNGITFDPVLNGTLNLLPQGFDLKVAGVQDRIALDLAPSFRPRSLNVERGEASLIGQTRGNIFQVAVRQFPIDGFILPGVDVSRYGGIGGTLAGNLDIDLDRLRVIDGTATVQNFRLGSFRTDVASTSFVNRNNVFEFGDTVLTRGQSKYTVSGNVDLRSQPKFNGKIAIAQGRIEDVLGGLQFFDLQDFTRGAKPPTYNRADALNPVAVGNPQALLFDQLRRFAEINALLRLNNQAIANNRIPQTADIRGNFGGEITLSASAAQGVQANFDLRAQDVEYRPYQSQIRLRDGKLQPVNDRVLTAQQVIALGSLNNGVVSLEPLRIQSGESQINLTGQFGGETQFGQLEVQNLPIAEIDRFYPLPLGIDGKLNTTVTISGTRTNPSAVGQIRVIDGFLNDKAINSATGNFTYTNSRLNFGSNIALSTNEPITIEGSFPYQLLPDSVRPESNQISLNLDVKNEGLSVLNVLVPQLAWRDGQGAVKLNVAGTLLRPEVTGSIVLAGATIESTALQEPLTDITGTILFNRDRISVESLQGQFNRGQVIAKGTLPILVAADADPNNPLQITLDRLAINRKGLYQGGVTGNITVLGTAFAPEIGGEVELADGQIQLPDTEATGGAMPPAASGSTNSQAPQLSASLNDLKLVLGNRVQIVRAPLINFVASGTLTVNGRLDALRPEGTIRLRSGQVNLFTTQFVLERGYPQTATFVRDRGLDPVLDVRLIASVPEVTGSRIATPGTAEVSDSPVSAASIANLGSLRTVRIQAKATGPASQLLQNLELTSSPSRSRSEIVSLIGGGFVNTLGRGDSALGIANLAGSALLTNIQGFIGNALGLSDFRLFPTLLDRGQQRGSTLGLAAEVGVDITRNLSASVLRVLTADQPTQFGVRYRFSDRLLFRGSTDFSGDTQGVFEYEFRF